MPEILTVEELAQLLKMASDRCTRGRDDTCKF